MWGNVPVRRVVHKVDCYPMPYFCAYGENCFSIYKKKINEINTLN